MAFNWEPKPKPRHAEVAQPHDGVPRCKRCGYHDIVEDSSSGDRTCMRCGVVLQENNIVSTVQFSDAGGSSNVVGQFVSGDKGRPSGGGANRGRGRFGHSRDSRETTIQNGKKKIIQVGCLSRAVPCACCLSLSLPLARSRALFSLAVRRPTFGRWLTAVFTHHVHRSSTAVRHPGRYS